MRDMGPHATTETLLCGINTFGGVAKERGTVIASMPGAGTWSSLCCVSVRIAVAS